MQLAANDKPASELKKTALAEQVKQPSEAPPAAFGREKTLLRRSETDTSASPESLLDKNEAAASRSLDVMAKKEQQSALAAATSPASPQPQSGATPRRYDLGRGLPPNNNLVSAPSSAVMPLSLSDNEVRLMKETGPLANLASGSIATTTNNVVQYGLFTASQTFNYQTRDVAVLRSRAFNAPAAAPAIAQQGQLANRILVSFRVEQSGHELRVIDSDNSIYSGPIQETNLLAGTATQAEPMFSDAVENAKRKPDSGQQPGIQNLGAIFKVTGTNRTSNQRVVFTGLLTGATNVPGMGGRLQNHNAAGVAGAAVSVTPGDLKNQALQLNGTALIDGNQEIQINAVPVSK